jgi:hypothetical protein
MTRTMDPFDELASMFLTEDDAAGAKPPPTDRELCELLVVGHLPVRASLWLTPYADAVARSRGPTALVRLDADDPVVQILRGPRETVGATSRNLREMILNLGSTVQAWIIHPALRVQAHELLNAAVDRITILSSADQAARTAAYSVIKDLRETAAQIDRDVPPLALAVIGAEQDAARDFAKRLGETTREYLDLDVALSMSLPRMDAAIRSSDLRSFPAQATPSLADVTAWVGEARTHERRMAAVPGSVDSTEPDEEPTVAEQIDREIGVVEVDQDAVRRAMSPAAGSTSPLPESAPADARVSASIPVGAPLPEALEDVTTRKTVKLDPKPVIEIEPKVPADIREPDDEGKPVPLARHVPGLTPLTPRPPGHERIELAVDVSGRLHLLGREEVMREFPIVESWAKAHRELLAMACPEQNIAPGGEVIHHVFTDRPVSLADLQGSTIRLHVLAPVDVAGNRGWYSAALNEPR